MKYLGGGLISAILLISGLTLGLPLGHMWPTTQIFWQLRVPRLIFALIGGGMLAVSAVIFQTTLRNRYVDGGMLGLASGVELGNALIAVIFAPATPWRVLTGALWAIVWLLILRASMLRILRQPLQLLLGGLGVAMLLNAITTLITSNQGFVGKSLANVTLQDTWLLAIFCVVGIIIWQIAGPTLTYFALPQIHVGQLGIDEKRLSLLWQLGAALFIGAVTAVLGSTFFVGLIIAQVVAQLMTKPAQNRLVVTGLLGAVMLSGSDLLAHSLHYPLELPTGAVLMLLTAPLLLVFWKRGHDVN
ncbi:iron chelate uptake ABC transporter family permease subunit [Periweissella fabalis]|uniref:Iron ABC transporter permease n=1 Tax=Periweissella fabalis TaxID=1070421 RepID=A0A7X6S3A1_9LACO|nr:iron chelate uptake ABC transporter family permease subunit [Periweissella fabalis]MCM0598385.1 iron chelate uptake ABC transporter family permease subunit [Periweissella fabalis]NKZ23976.1 iron ABC transporter permease [Periweissella fabalis]